MEIKVENFGENFKFENFKKCFKITWLYVGIGFIVYYAFVMMALTMPKKSFLYFFMQNIGIFFMFTSLLMAYAGVYRLKTSPSELENQTLNAIKATFKRSHFILAISLSSIILLTIILLLEVGISNLSHIPKIGPIIISLLTIPFFLINLTALIIIICIFAIFPPLISEISSIKDILIEFKISIKNRWINVVLYLMISLGLLFFSIGILYLLTGQAAGLTKSIQWKINLYYPPILKNFTMTSFFTDTISKINPKPNSLGLMGKYSFGFFNYSDLVKYIINFSYTIIFSFIISFPLAVYFSISSIFFGKVNSE